MSRSGLLSDLIGRLVRVVIRFPLITTLSVLALSIAGLAYAVSGHLGINTNTANMISAELPWRQDFERYRASFPARDGNIVVVIDGDTPELATRYAAALGEVLLSEPEIFPAVFLGRNSAFFRQNGLLYMGLDEFYALTDRLSDAQPLLYRLAEETSGAAVIELLSDALGNREALSASTAVALDELITMVGSTFSAHVAGEQQPIAWSGLFGTDFASTTRQLLLVRPVEDARRIPAKTSIDRLLELRAQFVDEFGNTVNMRVTGTPAMEYEELTSITDSALSTGATALILVLLVLFWFLRSVRLLLVSLVTLLSGLCLTAAFAALTVGELNLLSVAFAVLYVGLGVDFILHVLLRVEELRGPGNHIRDAMFDAARGVGASLVICAVTTAVGFFAFVPTDFIGISALGLIAGGGMFVSLFVSLTLLPALVVLTTRDRPANAAVVRLQAHGLRLKAPPPRLTCAIAAIVMLIALWFLPPRFDGNPVNLRDPDAESVQALNDLAADQDAPIFSLAVIADSAPEAAALATELSALGTVHQVQTVQSWIPQEQDAKLSEIEFLALDFGPVLAGVTPAVAAPGRVINAVRELAGLLANMNVVSTAQSALRASAEAWLAQAEAADATVRAAAARALDLDVRGNLVDELALLHAGLSAQAFGVDDLPAEIRERWLNAAGQQIVEIVPRENLNDKAAAARFVTEVRAFAPSATGLPVVYEKAAETVTRAFTQALIYAAVAVSLMLLLFLRSLRDAALVMTPIVFAAVVTAGISALIGLDLNFANIIALPLLVGIGVDSGVHVVHRMRTEPPGDGNPLRTSTSRAVFASALTTIASFGNLAFASHVGMASMGQLLTLGMVLSLVSVLMLLPALMRLGQAK